jgi:hypothetical protein
MYEFRLHMGCYSGPKDPNVSSLIYDILVTHLNTFLHGFFYHASYRFAKYYFVHGRNELLTNIHVVYYEMYGCLVALPLPSHP